MVERDGDGSAADRRGKDVPESRDGSGVARPKDAKDPHDDDTPTVVTRRAEDWAIVGVCALVKASDGSCEDVRITLTNMGSRPLRASAAEDALRGQPLDAERIAAAAEQAAEGTEPPGDVNATPDYKRHLARVLSRRALTQAAGLD